MIRSYHQSADKGQHDRQRQHVRPRQEMSSRHQQRQRDKQNRARWVQIWIKQVDEDRDRHSDRERRQDDRTCPVECPMNGGKEHLREPGTRDPGFAKTGERIDVGVGHGAMIEDRLPDLDLPQRVRIP